MKLWRPIVEVLYFVFPMRILVDWYILTKSTVKQEGRAGIPNYYTAVFSFTFTTACAFGWGKQNSWPSLYSSKYYYPLRSHKRQMLHSRKEDLWNRLTLTGKARNTCRWTWFLVTTVFLGVWKWFALVFFGDVYYLSLVFIVVLCLAPNLKTVSFNHHWEPQPLIFKNIAPKCFWYNA